MLLKNVNPIIYVYKNAVTPFLNESFLQIVNERNKNEEDFNVNGANNQTETWNLKKMVKNEIFFDFPSNRDYEYELVAVNEVSD